MEPLPWVFFSKRLWLQWKAFDLLNKLRLILWVVTLMEACDVTKHGRHCERHLGFYQELENSYKPRELIIFFVLNMCKITQISTLHHLIHNLYFYWWTKLKNMHFHLKMAWPPAIYDDTSPYHIVTDHHQSCLKMCAREKRTATENFRCRCFIVLKGFLNFFPRGMATIPLPLVRPRV